MPATQPFALIADLQRLNQQLVELPCPACGGHDPHLIWRRDRYFLTVNLSSCRACGLVYLARGLQGEAQDRFYAHFYPRLMKQPPDAHSLWNYRMIAGYRHNEISAVIGPIDSVLDIGAGLGFFLDACRGHGCGQYLGLEPGGPQREHAVHTLGLGGHVLDRGLDEGTVLSFRPRLITLFHVLEHLEDPGKALQRAAALIDPEGWLVIEVPDIRAPWRGLGLQQVHVSHRSYFCEATLTALLQRNGFGVHRTVREPHGIYEGNLRMYARPGFQARQASPLSPPSPSALAELKAHVLRHISPWSLRNGYPRSAIRLCKLSMKGH